MQWSQCSDISYQIITSYSLPSNNEQGTNMNRPSRPSWTKHYFPELGSYASPLTPYHSQMALSTLGKSLEKPTSLNLSCLSTSIFTMKNNKLKISWYIIVYTIYAFIFFAFFVPWCSLQEFTKLSKLLQARTPQTNLGQNRLLLPWIHGSSNSTAAPGRCNGLFSKHCNRNRFSSCDCWHGMK